MYRAFQGANGWYVAFERADGSHKHPGDAGRYYASRIEALTKANELQDIEDQCSRGCADSDAPA